MPKLRTLVLFKSNLSVENYLLLHIPRRLRVALAKFRVGNHDLEIEKGRYVKVPVDERFCKLCLTLNENLNVVSRGAVRSAASSYPAMRTVAGSRPVLVIV